MACNYGSIFFRILRRNHGVSTLTKRSKHGGSASTATEYNSELCFLKPESVAPMPTYRVLGQDGHFIDPNNHPHIEESVMLKMYRNMIRLNVMDKILYDCQRQGRISFYLTNFGEEGTQIGSAAALDEKDLVFGQYRETGVLLWRDFPLSQFFHQCYGNIHDFSKGRQMPVHYGSKKCGFVTISPTLATQMPQACGAAYSFKLQQSEQCVMCYFGDGATSEGDAHAGFNFASVLNCPVIYLCRNNGYAISTPTNEQYKGDGVASRGLGYGMTSIRVDGNDIFAVYNATREARKMCVTEKRPVLIESMTYRVGHHSTSDDSLTYRTEEEIKKWDLHDNPVTRLRNHLDYLGLWDDTKEKQLLEATRREVMSAMALAESEKKCNPDEMFGDVYDEMPASLRDQRDATRRHLKKYREHYPMEHFEQGTT